jgi:hypothetical protein
MALDALLERARQSASRTDAAPGAPWRSGLTVIALVALLLRLAVILLPAHFVLWGDPVDYQYHAIWIANGHGYPPTAIATPGTPSAFRPPAYPYLLGLLYAVAGIHLTLARILGAVLGVVTVLLTAQLGAALWDRRIGLLAGAIAAVCPSLIVLNSSLLSETLFLPLELAVALTILALRRGGASVRLGLALGALCGLAALTRSEGILWLLPALLAALLAPGDWRRRVLGAAAILLACAAVLAPWTIRNAEALHAFVPLNTQGGFTLVGQYNSLSGNNDYFEAVPRIPAQIPSVMAGIQPLLRRAGGINEAQLDGVLRHDALVYIEHHPLHVPVAVGLDLLRMFNLGKNHEFTSAIAYRQMGLPHSAWNPTTIVIQLITVLAILGVLLRVAGLARRRLGSPLVWAVPLISIGASSLVGGTVRYRAPADPFLILLAALAISALAPLLQSGYSSLRHARGSLSWGFGVRSSRKEW